jgi:hypothetical protein
MAKLSSSLVAVLLLTAVAAVSLAAEEPSLMGAAPVRPVGCHQHGATPHGATQDGATPPASAPVSYRCCQLGHNSAVLQNSLTSQPSLVVTTSDSTLAAIVFATPTGVRSLTVSSPDPPHTIPLRV